MRSLSGSDPLEPNQDRQSHQTPKKTSTPSNSTDGAVSKINESFTLHFREQPPQTPEQQLQNYTKRHEENIKQQKQEEQQKLEQELELERQQSSEKAIENIRKFLESHDDIHERQICLKEGIIYAVGSGDAGLLKFCCESGGSHFVNQNNIPGFPPDFTLLMLVALRPVGDESSLKILKILLKNGADPNAIDNQGKMALDYLEDGLILSQKVFKQCKELLIQKGSEGYRSTPERYEQAHEKWKGWKLEHPGTDFRKIVKYQIDKRHVYKWAFNHILAETSAHSKRHDYAEFTFQDVAHIIEICMKLLKLDPVAINYNLERGVDFFDDDALVAKAINHASKSGDWNTIIRLLEVGVDRKKTALIKLFKTLEDPPFEIVQHFVERCDITARDREGNTALMLAISQNMSVRQRNVQALRRVGDYDVDLLYYDGSYEKNNLKVIKFLLSVFGEQKPALICASNKSGETALTLAQHSFSTKIKKLFLS